MGRENQGSDLIKGALLGGVIGGVAALLLAPKSGRELRETLAEASETIRQTGRKLAHPFQSEVEGNGQSHFLIGSAAGAIIGAIAALLLAPQSGEELREALGDKYTEIREKAEDFISDVNAKRQGAMEQLTDWKDSLITIVNRLSQSKGKKSPFKLDEILDWASLGLDLFQKLQKRR